MTPPPGTGALRVASLDQYRGYTMLAMFVVNFAGDFAALPALFKHHNTHNSYADTIMPHFFFAAGFAMRLGVWRALGDGAGPAVRRTVARRAVALVLLGVVVHTLDGRYASWAALQAAGWDGVLGTAFRQNVFQALTHIGLTTLWLAPVIHRRTRDLLLFAAASGALHLALSAWFWYDQLMAWRVIDGGALGFLSWTLPMVAGAAACDVVRDRGAAAARRPLAAWGAAAAVAGYALSCVHGIEAPPFVPPWHPVDLWTMTQRAGSLSYQLFSAGFSLLVYVAFLGACDVRRPAWRSGFLQTLGINPLAGYLLHFMVWGLVGPFAPADAPGWYATAITAVFVLITWRLLRALEARQLYLRL